MSLVAIGTLEQGEHIVDVEFVVLDFNLAEAMLERGSFEHFALGVESFTDVLKAAWDGLCNLLAPIFEGVFQNISNIFSEFTGVLLDVAVRIPGHDDKLCREYTGY